MYCFPARTSGSYICSYCIICKAPLFSDLKDMAGPSSVHCDGAQSADGCKMHPCPIKSRLLLLYYITEPQIAFLYHNTGLNLSMNNRATTFLTCFGASTRIICSVSKTPHSCLSKHCTIVHEHYCTYIPNGFGDLHACILMLQQYNTLYMYMKI